MRTVGLAGSARAWVLSRVARRLDAPLICVTPDDDSADTLASDLAFFLGGEGTRLAPTVVRLPSDEVLPWDELVPDAGVVADRLGALFHLAHGVKFPALVLSVRALARKVIPLAVMKSLSAVVKVGEDQGRDVLGHQLAAMGYRNAPLVEDPAPSPCAATSSTCFPRSTTRREFFGDTIESMRSFDPGTQRTIEGITVHPAAGARPSSPRPPAARPRPRCARRRRAHLEGARAAGAGIREGSGAAAGSLEGGLASVFTYLRPWHPAHRLARRDPPRRSDRWASPSPTSSAATPTRCNARNWPPPRRTSSRRRRFGGGAEGLPGGLGRRALALDVSGDPPLAFSFGSTGAAQGDPLASRTTAKKAR